ncbi:MAG: hypothetical protein ACM3YN_09350 [Parcubacteria group bacterium]
MNRATHQFWRTSGRLLFSAAGLMALAACVSVPNEPYANAAVDQNSSAAAQVAAQASQNAPFPTFASIPQAPGDVRSVEGWNIAVTASEAERQQLLAEVAPSTFSLANTEGFIAAQRAAIDYNPADVPPADQAARSAAWAKAMRARATPPPRPR